MKKLLAGTLTAAFALGLTACGQQEECSAKPFRLIEFYLAAQI